MQDEKEDAAVARPTAGERLAAALNVRAARKAQRHGRQAERVESEALRRIGDARRWWHDNRRRGVLWAGGLLLLVAGVSGGMYLWRRQERRASAALVALVAPQRPAARDDARDAAAEALPANQDLQRWLKQHPRASAAGWARLAQAASLMEAGEVRQARQVWLDSLRRDGDDGWLRWRALEGIAATHEAEGDWPAAQARYEQVLRIEGGAFAPHARHALARVLAAQGQVQRAGKELAALAKSLLGDTRSDMVSLRAQVEHDQRLLKVDARALRAPESFAAKP